MSRSQKKNWFVSPFDSELKKVTKLPINRSCSEILKSDALDQYNDNIFKKTNNVNSLATSLVEREPKKSPALANESLFVSPFGSELKEVDQLPVKCPGSGTLKPDVLDQYNRNNLKKTSSANSSPTSLLKREPKTSPASGKKGWFVSPFDSELKKVTKLPVKRPCSEIVMPDILDQYNEDVFKKMCNVNSSANMLLECETKTKSKLTKQSWFVSPFDSELKKVTNLPVERPCSNMLKADASDRYNEDIYKKASKVDSLPTWLLECEPKKCSELAVSRQKQQELSSWFVEKIKQRQPSMLIVSGPSGCGKTVAVRVLAKENGYNVVEWINPIDQAVDENYKIMRQGQVFEDFLIRTTRYSSISNSSIRQLLLVKDFPNAYIRDKESFFAVLEKYSELGKEPVVFICTESGSSRLQHTLFPPEIQQKFDISVINVNSVTQAAMKKALQRTSGILNSTASRYINVSQHEVNEILSNNTGDIRGAVLNLIFISLKVPKKLARTEKESSGRDENIGLLHAIGRVINPKRIQDGDLWKFVYNPDDIALLFQSQATTFLSFLQENYLNTIGQFEDVIMGSDILSLSDILNSEWRDISLSRTTLSFCVRGIMVANQKPVSGWNPVRKPHSERPNLQRRLCTAEVRWYESIINPGTSKDETKLHNTEFEGHIE